MKHSDLFGTTSIRPELVSRLRPGRRPPFHRVLLGYTIDFGTLFLTSLLVSLGVALFAAGTAVLATFFYTLILS